MHPVLGYLFLTTRFSIVSRKLVLLENIIAWPVAWYTMVWWLADFAYRTDIDISFFFLSGLVALGVALTTVGYQVFKTANANLIIALRNSE